MISPCRFRAVEGSTTRTPEEFEATLRTYGSERAEEARAVRVGEKERSEAAAIVARYADLFTREQLDHLRQREDEERRRCRARAPPPASEVVRGRLARTRARPPPGRGAERAARDPRRVPRGGDALAQRAGQARRARRVRRARGAGRDPRRRDCDDERAASRRRPSRGEDARGAQRHRGSRRAVRRRQGHLAPAARRGAPRRQRARRGLLRGDAGAMARPHPRRRAPGEPVRLSRCLRAAAVAAQGRLLRRTGRPKCVSRR